MTFEIHPLANIVPMADELEQSALQQDIKDNGLLEDIITYRDKVVDGRCRIKACNALGMDISNRIKVLDRSMTLDEVSAHVVSLNTRRNLTITQKSLVAYRAKLANPSIPAKVLMAKWGLLKANYHAAKTVSILNPAYADRLYKGGTVEIADNKRSRSIRAVALYLKGVAARIAGEPEPTGYEPKEVKCPHCVKTFMLEGQHFTGN